MQINLGGLEGLDAPPRQEERKDEYYPDPVIEEEGDRDSKTALAQDKEEPQEGLLSGAVPKGFLKYLSVDYYRA